MNAHSSIKPLVQAWVHDRRLGEIFESSYAVAEAWTVACSPRNASTEQLAIATMDLLLWFLYLDDFEGADDARLHRHLAAAMTRDPAAGETEDFSDSSVLRQFSEQTARLTRRGLPMARYLGERQTALSSYERRNRLRREGWTPTFAQLLDLREVTTLIRVWFTLWEILGQFQLTQHDYESPIFDRAITATTRWHVFANEIHSVDRDQQEGMPNLVLCLERDHAVGRQDALALLRRHCESQSNEVNSAWKEAQARNLAAGHLGDALRFLHLTIDGARELYSRQLDRYRPPPADPISPPETGT